MLSHEEMIALQADKHELLSSRGIRTKQEFILNLIHSYAYVYLSNHVKGKDVLDLGCNTGYGSNILSQSARRVVGVDVSKSAIDIALKENSGSNTEFLLVDGQNLPFNNNNFDVVVNCQVIEHIVDYKIFLDEMKRVLLPNGKAIFTTPNALLRLDPGMKPWYQFHVREFDHVELKDLLDNYFGNVSIEGLFANESTYIFEKNRLNQLREKARKQQRKVPICKVKSKIRNLLPSIIIKYIKLISLKTVQKNSMLDEAFMNEHKLGNFYYHTQDLDNALDLLAVCEKKR